MPSTYAHYRLGRNCIPKLPDPVRELVERHRGLYDLGLHGPDFLFYHDPITKDRLYRLGRSSHRLTGREFFTRAAERLRGDGAAKGYLFGVLGHFALDSLCHPFVNARAEAGTVGHMELETDLDRALLALDGQPRPHAVKLTGHIRVPSTEDAARIARFYPGVTEREVRASFRRCRFLADFCTAPAGLRRSLLEKGVFTSMGREMLMGETPNPRCAALLPELLELCAGAEELFPRLCAQLEDHLTKNAPLGVEFDRIFG